MIRLLHHSLALLALTVSMVFGTAAFACMSQIGASPPVHVSIERDAVFTIGLAMVDDLHMAALPVGQFWPGPSPDRTSRASVCLSTGVSAATAWQPPAFRAPPRQPV